jgi:hypothetical protein
MRGARRGLRGENLEGIMIFSTLAQNSAISSARFPSLRFAETAALEQRLVFQLLKRTFQGCHA